jgi:hypothetical protein
VPTFADRGCHMVSVTDPYSRILGFLGRNLIEHKNIIHFIKSRRMIWLGHVERITEEKGVKKIYKV